MAKVTGIGVAAEDSTRITMEAMLYHSAEEYAQDFPKGVLLLLNEDDGQYQVGYRVAGLSSSEILALLEVAKVKVLQDMGCIPDD